MEVKIDTKEKFTVVTPVEPLISDNIAEELTQICLNYLNQPVKNLILKLDQVDQLTPGAAALIASLQQQFYENSASFVICHVKKELEQCFEQEDLLDLLNITPTESEAWDIVQMEEIERELLDGDLI